MSQTCRLTAILAPVRKPSTWGEGSYKKVGDQPHALEPTLSRAMELIPNLSADYLTAETTVVTPASN